MEKLGIENVKLLTVAVSSLGESLEKIFSDGKVDWTDTAHLGSLFAPLMSMSNIDLKAIFPEMKDLDSQEMDELNILFKDNFDIQDDDLEANLEKGMDYVVRGVEAVQFFVGLAKKA